jgi:hypothetical protein
MLIGGQQWLASGNPVWSPDGTHIAFECVGPGPSVCMISVDDGEVFRPFDHVPGDQSSYLYNPAWIPYVRD